MRQKAVLGSFTKNSVTDSSKTHNRNKVGDSLWKALKICIDVSSSFTRNQELVNH